MGGRKAIDLEPYREYIVEQIMGGTPVKTVAKILKENFKVKVCSRCTLRLRAEDIGPIGGFGRTIRTERKAEAERLWVRSRI